MIELLFADAFSVSTSTGIDFDDVALIDEKGNLNFITVVDFCRFGDDGGGIAADTGFSFNDLFLDEGRQSDVDGFTVEEDEVAETFFDEEIGFVAENFRSKSHFFVGHRIAENVVVTVVV